jgi:DNA polymerase III epsilon subunit-like protein
VVLDTETTETPDGTPRRCVSVGAVTCRHGTVRSRWQRLVDPGIPIDPISHSIHHISNDHLAGEASFDDIADELLALLEPRDGETVIVAAHNVGFDISVLRYELQQTDRDLPDVPVLDTMGPLVALAGVELQRPSLNDLLAELGLVNRAAHDALADAEACAAALLVLLERIAERGHSDRDELLAELGTATTHRIMAGSRAKLPRPAAAHEDLPPGHVEGHRDVLGARAGARMLAAWQTAVTECAVLRCGHLTGRVERAEPKPPRLVGPLTDVLDGRLADSDTAGAATVLAALVPLLEHLPPRQGRLGKRNATLAWVDARASSLAALGRCSEDDGCPACRAGEPCALDLWPDTVAQLALGDPERYARGFFEMTGKEAGTGAYTSWLGRGVDQRVCDAALWRCVEHWRAVEMFKRAEQVIELGWAAGCRHPDLADAYAGQLAASGRLASYERAIDVCDEALGVADGSTHPGWARLRSRRNQLAGRRQRLVVRPSGKFDEDGNPIPARRHHPTKPRRTRPMRFVDAGPTAGPNAEQAAT